MAGQGGAHDACGSSRCSALLSHSDHAQPHSCRAHEAHRTLPTKPLVSAAQLLTTAAAYPAAAQLLANHAAHPAAPSTSSPHLGCVPRNQLLRCSLQVEAGRRVDRLLRLLRLLRVLLRLLRVPMLLLAVAIDLHCRRGFCNSH